MPLKREVTALADSLDPWTRLSGVANTLLLGDRRRLAFNTDIPGAKAALAERGVDLVRSAVVLGGGATAASVLLAVAELGCRRATLVVRDPARAEETLSAVREHPRAPEVVVTTFADIPRGPTDLLVSTIPATAQTEDVLAAALGCPERVRGRLRPVADPARPGGAGDRSHPGQRPGPARPPGGPPGPADDRPRRRGRPGPATPGIAELDRRAGDNAGADA